MNGIRISDTYLDLYPNTTFSIELVSPFYLGEDSDIIQGGILLTTAVPMSPRNRRILLYPDVLNNALRFVKNLQSTVMCEGVEMLQGYLEVTEATEKQASIRMVFNELAALKETPLSNLDLGEVPVDSDTLLQHATDTVFNPDGYNYVFASVHNPSLIEPKEGYDYTWREMQNRFNPSQNLMKVSPATPMLKAKYVLKKAFESQGYSVSNDVLNSRELNWLLLYSATSLYQDSTLGTIALDFAAQYKPLNRHVSDTIIATWVKNMCRLFSAAPFYNIFDKTVQIQRLDAVINAAPAHDWSSKLLKDYRITESDVDIDSLKFKAQTLSGINTEDIEVIDFLKYFSLQDFVIAMSQLPQDRSYALRNWDGRYYFSEHQADDAFAQRFIRYFPKDSQSLKSLKTANNKAAYEAPFDILPTAHTQIRRYNSGDTEVTQGGVPQSVFGYMPTAKLQGRAKVDRGDNPNPDALLLHRGMRLYDGSIHLPSYILPFSCNETDTPGMTHSLRINAPVKVGFDTNNPPPQYAPTPAQHSLHWAGEDGLYNRFWKQNVDFIREQRSVSFRMALHVVDIRNFRFNQKIAIKGRDYLVKKMKLTLTMQGLRETEIECISII
jgi:hypothetical protein